MFEEKFTNALFVELEEPVPSIPYSPPKNDWEDDEESED